MRSRGRHLNRYRERHPAFGISKADSMYGYFVIPNNGEPLRVISSGDKGDDPSNTWEHVSVSLANRCPTWDEMSLVKDLFLDGFETVIQFHPTKVAYVNVHPYCLHLWKKSGHVHELPPQWMLA